MKLPAVWRRPAYLPPETSLGSPHIITLMMRYVRRRGTAIQAGAHVGLWPAVLSQHFKRVVSFEPLPQLAAVAREGAPYANVTIMEAALGAECGTLRIQPPGAEKMARFSGSATVTPEGALEVTAVTLDSLHLHNVGAVMLDIEGHELPALEGARHTLERWHPVVVIEENAKSLRHRAAGAAAAFLSTFGYEQVGAFRSDLVFAVKS